MIVPIIEITTRCGEASDVPRATNGLNKHAGAKGGSPWHGLCCRRDTLMLSVRWAAEHLTTEQIQRATAAAIAEIMASGVPPIVARDAYSFWATLNWTDWSLAQALKPLVEGGQNANHIHV